MSLLTVHGVNVYIIEKTGLSTHLFVKLGEMYKRARVAPRRSQAQISVAGKEDRGV